MTNKTVALVLADALEAGYDPSSQEIKAAAELRRLHTLNQELLENMKLIAETDPVDAALDPQRAVRVARAAIAQATGKTK